MAPSAMRKPSFPPGLLLGLIIVALALSLGAAVELHDSSGPANQAHDRAIAAARSADLTVATTEMEKAIRLDPHQADWYERLADLYVGAGEPMKALDALQRLGTLDPGRTHLHTRIAEIYVPLESALLLRSARQAVLYEPQSPRARLLLAVALARFNDVADALREAEIAQRLAPSPPLAAAITELRQSNPAPSQAALRLIPIAMAAPY